MARPRGASTTKGAGVQRLQCYVRRNDGPHLQALSRELQASAASARSPRLRELLELGFLASDAGLSREELMELGWVLRRARARVGESFPGVVGLVALGLQETAAPAGAGPANAPARLPPPIPPPSPAPASPAPMPALDAAAAGDPDRPDMPAPSWLPPLGAVPAKEANLLSDILASCTG